MLPPLQCFSSTPRAQSVMSGQQQQKKTEEAKMLGFEMLTFNRKLAVMH